MRVLLRIGYDTFGRQRLPAVACSFSVVVALIGTSVLGQTKTDASRSAERVNAEQQQSRPTLSSPNYVLGPDDVITLLTADVDEINKTILRVGLDGEISLPLIGRLHVGGLTVNEAEQNIDVRLKKFIRHPDVVLNITEYHSQPVSVLGEVNTPGVFQLQGNKSLYELISMAGGMGEVAGNTITITRKLKWGLLPLSDARTDATGQYSIGTVNIKDLVHGTNPQVNIQVQPEDVISIAKQEEVFVIGAVIKPGAVGLGDEKSITALQALSKAWGLGNASSPSKAKLMRLIPGTNGMRSETTVDLKKLLAGKTADVQLQANDILVVPRSLAKSVAGQVTQTALGVGSVAAIATR